MAFVRVAAASPRVYLGDCQRNAEAIWEKAQALAEEGAQIAVFPELCLTGYTCQDLFLNQAFQRSAREALTWLARRAGEMILIVGLPYENQGRLYNCGAVLQNGRVLGLAPKRHLPNGGEFYETRWFVSGRQCPETALWEGTLVPFGLNLLFETGDCAFALEICEDLWTCDPPSSRYAPGGAELVFNLSASNELAAKHAYRQGLLSQQSARCFLGYVYAGAGYGESTTDLVFSGYTAVYENGRQLSQGERFNPRGGQAVADVDLQRLRYQRQRTGSFFDCDAAPMRRVAAGPLPRREGKLLRPLDPLPFVPQGPEGEARCREITAIQVTALRTRLEATGLKKLVVGVSGGLDSTLALLVAARAYQEMGWPSGDIIAITMPGFGTGKRTRGNAGRLMDALGVTALEIPIGPAVKQHFQDIGQDESLHDVTYENSQARERTQILMDYANKAGGLVLGTGDLSESALGFSTYNGDHMSMYNVNCAIPKTLVRALVSYLGAACFGPQVAAVCQDINETPISPELLPVEEGELNQRTEDILGNYALHDFFLYHMMDSGSGADRLRLLANQAFGGRCAPQEIEKALSLFIRRFYQQQFKRSCAPDGPKVGSVSLSPRGDWRLPSDLSYQPFMP